MSDQRKTPSQPIAKAVLLRKERLGYAVSWAEVRTLLALCGWHIKTQMPSFGVEGRGCFLIDERVVERVG